MVIRPPALRPGMSVGVAAPCSPFRDEPFERGCALLREAGFPLIVREDIRARHRYLAGDDERRAAELMALFADDRVGAIFTARGGYGAMRLLERLDPALIRRNPKPLVGFSDITALHAFLGNRCGMTAIHGPLLTTLADEPPAARDHLFRLLRGEAAGTRLPGTVLQPGRVTGPLWGGCLSLLSSLAGTPYFPDLRGAILFFEEVGERPYRLDRMLTHLALTGALREVRGVVVGQLEGCAPPAGDGYTALEVVAEQLHPLGVPVLAELPAGHGHPNYALPMGVHVTIDGAAGELILAEEAVKGECDGGRGR